MISLLLDQNTPYGAAALLNERGVDTLHTRDAGLERASDAAITDAAAAMGRVVITHDADFSQLLALSGRLRPSVIHLRREFDTNGDFVACVCVVLATVGREILEGAVVSVDETSIRVRHLPLLGQPRR